MRARVHCPDGLSKAETVARENPEGFRAWVASLSRRERRQLLFLWGFWRRPKQALPDPTDNWMVWLLLAGRGFGKTRTKAEAVRELVDRHGYRRLGLIAPTAADVRDVMVEGESGLLSVYPSERKPFYEPSKRRITFWNGAVATCYSAEEPKRLRGPQHDLVWLDEPAAYPDLDLMWQLLVPGLRLSSRTGLGPKALLSTTPLPLQFFSDRLQEDTTVFTNGSTWENTHNLAENTLNYLQTTLAGTDIGDQELEGKLLGNNPGALWNSDWITAGRVELLPQLKRIVVAIDPSAATTASAASCEVGIVVVGQGYDGLVYVLEDLSGRMTPGEWAKVSLLAADRWRASGIVYEANLGPGLILEVFKLHDPKSLAKLRKAFASHDKARRATPIAAATQKGRVRFVGTHKALESQLTTWIPGVGKSPDRLDAMVWGCIYLLGGGSGDAPSLDAMARLSRLMGGSSYDSMADRQDE